MNCKPDDLAIIVRNVTQCPCVQAEIGRTVRVLAPFDFWGWTCWAIDGLGLQCPHCGGLRLGYLDADLQPIRGDAKRDPVHDLINDEADTVSVGSGR